MSNNYKIWNNFVKINPFDIVYAYFPYQDDQGNRTQPDKCHYCVVLDKNQLDPAFNTPTLIVAYGTSSNIEKRNYTDLIVDLNKLENKYFTGLYRNTKFELGNRIPLPYTDEYFIPRKGAQDPLIGTLNIKEEFFLLNQIREIKKIEERKQKK